MTQSILNFASSATIALSVRQTDALDTAVLSAHGFSAKKDLLAQLLALNLEVAANIEKGSPVMPPGVPKNYPDTKKLVTEDCVRPEAALAWSRP